MLTAIHLDIRLRYLELKQMENGVVSQLSICLTLVYPWQVRRLHGQSSWGKSILALILGFLLTSPAPRYGTPFLLSLGVSEQLTSLVWLAGPISGLIAQPVIGEPRVLTFCRCIHKRDVSPGAISDSSTSKYRRRYWVVLSTAALAVSTLVLAYCEEIASFFVDASDWDPKNHKV